MTIDYARLNSATKYPSIETYHQLDPANGTLLEAPMLFDGDEVVLTEKVNGASARIIVMPDGDFFIGSREELFHARGDRVWNTQLGIVDTLKDLADDGLYPASTGIIKTFYMEVFGGNIGGGYKNYTTNKTNTDYRLFDISYVPLAILDMSREQIASWRQHGGQDWADEVRLGLAEKVERVDLTPRLGVVEGDKLPRTIDDTLEWLQIHLPATEVALDPTGHGKGEGIVLRTRDRVTIVKAKFEDYERTIRKRGQDANKRGEWGKSK